MLYFRCSTGVLMEFEADGFTLRRIMGEVGLLVYVYVHACCADTTGKRPRVPQAEPTNFIIFRESPPLSVQLVHLLFAFERFVLR